MANKQGWCMNGCERAAWVGKTPASVDEEDHSISEFQNECSLFSDGSRHMQRAVGQVVA